MKTIERSFPGAAAFLAAALFLLPLASVPAWAGSGQVPRQRFFIAATAGYFYPGQAAFRRVYDKPAWPFELQLGWNLGRKISVFGGGRYLEVSGNTVLLEGQWPGETYALRLRLATLRLGVNYWLWPSRFSPFLGAGLSYNFYKEQWLDAPRTTQGEKTGFFIQAGGRYRLGRRWHALAQLEYSQVAAGSGARGKVNLGGLNLSLGLMAGLF
jgi:opacity protein-like surface antigen